MESGRDYLTHQPRALRPDSRPRLLRQVTGCASISRNAPEGTYCSRILRLGPSLLCGRVYSRGSPGALELSLERFLANALHGGRA